ncbi:hypothetical protein O5559_29550, partial [Escherichia coli]|nr:hypothetical protein [Escherichia coli]
YFSDYAAKLKQSGKRRNLPERTGLILPLPCIPGELILGALILFAVAKRGHAINTGKVLRGAPVSDTLAGHYGRWR